MGDYSISYGTKYAATKDLTVVQVAALVRAEIKAMVKAGTLPAAKYSVRSSHNTIDVDVTKLPWAVLDCDAYEWHGKASGGWLEQIRAVRFDAQGNRIETGRLTKEAFAVRQTLETMITAYNYDGSDISSDYFNVRFYLHLEVCPAEGEYEYIEKHHHGRQAIREALSTQPTSAPANANHTRSTLVAATGWDEVGQ